MKDIKDRGDHIKISIPQSKTEAGIRDVMIVGAQDCQLLREATKRATIVEPSCPENIGRLFPRIALGGYDRHPNHYLGKALEKARKNLDGDNSNWDMHSFRRTAGFLAALQNPIWSVCRNIFAASVRSEKVKFTRWAQNRHRRWCRITCGRRSSDPHSRPIADIKPIGWMPQSQPALLLFVALARF